jgi:hypothetical protein
MPSRYGDAITDWADIVTSTVTNGEVRLNLGDATKGTGVDSGSPFFGVDGYAAMPNEADSSGAAQCFYFISGNQKIGLGARDNRYLDKVGALKAGDRVFFSKGTARMMLKNADDLIVMYAEAQSDGTSQIIANSGKEGKILLSVGLTKVEISKDKIELSINGGPALVLDGAAQTISMRANLVNIDAGFCTLGVNSDGTRPIVPGLQSVCAGPSGQVAIGVPKVLVATY